MSAEDYSVVNNANGRSGSQGMSVLGLVLQCHSCSSSPFVLETSLAQVLEGEDSLVNGVSPDLTIRGQSTVLAVVSVTGTKSPYSLLRCPSVMVASGEFTIQSSLEQQMFQLSSCRVTVLLYFFSCTCITFNINVVITYTLQKHYILSSINAQNLINIYLLFPIIRLQQNY